MSHSLPGSDWVGSVIGGMDDRTGPLADDRTWTVEEEWPSFSARFLKLVAGGEHVALKLGTNWSADLVTYVAEEITRVGRLLSRLPSGRVVTPSVLGVSTDPPALALDYLPGEPLFEALPGLSPTRRSVVLARCGEAIGAYHASEPPADDAAATRAAQAELFASARRSGIRRRSVQRIEPTLTRSRGYRFSPNDFLLVDGDTLILLDPPHVRKYDYVHRDIGSFLMELHRSLVGESTPEGGQRVELMRAREDFLAGYRETGPDLLQRGEDRWVIDLFQVARIVGVAWNRFRAGEVGAAARALRWGWGLRRGLTHSGGDEGRGPI